MSGTLSAPSAWKMSVLALTLARISALRLWLAVMPPPCASTLVSFSFIAAAGSGDDRIVAPWGSDERCSRPIGIHTILSLVDNALALVQSAAQCGHVGSKNT